MKAKIPIPQLLTQLDNLRRSHGDEAYEAARKAIIFQVIDSQHGPEFIRAAWPELDIEQLKKEAAAHRAKHGVPLGGDMSVEALKDIADQAGFNVDREGFHIQNDGWTMPPEQLMLRAIQALMPELKTQGQLNIFMMGFDALKDAMSGAFASNTPQREKATKALLQAIDAAAQSVSITEKLQEIPEDQRSPEANAFMGEAKEFHEYDTYKRLVTELEGVETTAQLNQWYEDRREQRDRVVTQNLRNELHDAIRARRNALKAEEAN